MEKCRAIGHDYGTSFHIVGIAMRYIIMIGCCMAVVLNSCIQKKDATNVLPGNRPFPHLIDTAAHTVEYRNVQYRQTGAYVLLYRGVYHDTLYPQLSFYREYCDSIHTGFGFAYEAPDSNRIKIIVDTSFITNTYYPYWDENPIGGNAATNVVYKAHPVYLVNTSPDTLNICFGYFLHIVLQAKDAGGMWRPIEFLPDLDCGTGLGLESVLLPPGHIALSSVAIDRGSFRTKLRLCYNREVYSQEFEGSINPEQFRKRGNMVE